MDRTSLRTAGCSQGLPPGPCPKVTWQTPKFPMLGEYYFTCLSRKSQAVEKKRSNQHGHPPGKGTKGSGGKRDKGKELGAKKQQDLVGVQVLFHRLHSCSSSRLLPVSLGSPVPVLGPRPSA